MAKSDRKKKREIVDDSETESEADTRSRRRRVAESDFASDPAEDLSSISLDDDEESGDGGRAKREVNMRLDAAKYSAASDGDSDEESGDDAPNAVYRVGVGQIKDEQVDRDLFGDDEDDEDEGDENIDDINNDYNDNEEDEEEDLMWKSEGEDARAYDDESTEEESRPASSNMHSFTDELLMNSESNGDEHLLENTEDAADKPLRLSGQESFDTRLLMRNILSNLSTREKAGIRRGVRVVGPPIQEPNARVDEFKRKFRWPVRMINLPAKDFSQDPMEIFNDYELPVKTPDTAAKNAPPGQKHRVHASQIPRAASAFAQLPSPVVEAAAASVRLSRKRKRSHPHPEDAREGDGISAKKLTNLARIGTRFADRFLDSMIRDNAAVLQGEDKDYLQRSWTLVRIRDRLKKLYSLPWTTEDNELLARVDRSIDRSPAKAATMPANQPQSLDGQPSEEGRILML
ncbi:hypothetical protein FI667_g5446, partial [Globisporangium splendens]